MLKSLLTPQGMVENPQILQVSLSRLNILGNREI